MFNCKLNIADEVFTASQAFHLDC